MPSMKVKNLLKSIYLVKATNPLKGKQDKVDVDCDLLKAGRDMSKDGEELLPKYVGTLYNQLGLAMDLSKCS